jgi:hypothetical protein
MYLVITITSITATVFKSPVNNHIIMAQPASESLDPIYLFKSSVFAATHSIEFGSDAKRNNHRVQFMFGSTTVKRICINTELGFILIFKLIRNGEVHWGCIEFSKVWTGTYSLNHFVIGLCADNRIPAEYRWSREDRDVCAHAHVKIDPRGESATLNPGKYTSEECDKLSHSAILEFRGREETGKAVQKLWESFIDQLQE